MAKPRVPAPVEERFRSAVVPLDALAPLLNQWTADGFSAEVDWTYFEPADVAFGPPAQRTVHVWAWLAEDAPDEPPLP